jgi:lysophospholipase L1-like esterase
MLNFSSPGAQTTVDYTVGDSALTLEVPLIPLESSFVLFGGGVSDIANYSAGDLTQRLDTIDAAIRKRAPHAHIIYVGMRYFNDTLGDSMRKPLIDAWDDRERQIATSHGDRFVDTRVIVAPGRSADSPDGAHYSLAANRRIAAAIVRSIESLEPH